MGPTGKGSAGGPTGKGSAGGPTGKGSAGRPTGKGSAGRPTGKGSPGEPTSPLLIPDCAAAKSSLNWPSGASLSKAQAKRRSRDINIVRQEVYGVVTLK